MIDLWNSRRNKFLKCEYWSQETNPDIAKFSSLVYKTQPTGWFLASYVGNITEENQVLENAFMFEKVTTVIETTDDVKDLRKNDIVKMKDLYYRVDDVQRKPITKQEQFLKEAQSFTTYISLRR